MTKVAHFMLAVILLATGLIAMPHPAKAQELSSGCMEVNNYSGGIFGGIFISNMIYDFYAGERIVVTASSIEGGSATKTMIIFHLGDGVSLSKSFPGSIEYVIPADMAEVPYMSWRTDDGTVAQWHASCTGAGQEPSTEPSKPAMVPGCDAFLPLSETSVVGTFVADAPVYWTPGLLTNPLVTIPAGKTAWVLGQDESGMYNKIIWACSLIWVPKSAMGPTPDNVWQNRPLSSDIVR